MFSIIDLFILIIDSLTSTIEILISIIDFIDFNH